MQVVALKPVIGVRKLTIIFLTLISIAIHFSICITQIDGKYAYALLFLEMLLAAIVIFFILNKNLILFEPIVLFSAYYVTVFISGLSLILNDYSGNFFTENTTFRSEISTLTTYACIYYFFGYICVLLGYFFVKKKNIKIEFYLECKKNISDAVINAAICIYLAIGIINFIYNIQTHASGNLFEYMGNISLREYEFEVSGTTAGYIFVETAMYIWFFKLVRKRIFFSKSFLLFFAISLLIKVSTGRVFSTAVYISSLIGVYYFIEIGIGNIKNSAKYYISAVILVGLGVSVYLLRIISGMAASGQLKISASDQFEILVGEIGHIAINMGYIPNTGILIKIIDSWNADIGYLYGSSLVSWIFNVLPSSIKPVGYQPSVMISKTWYGDLPTGNLPPTGIGEMYANFGFIGPFFGMFLFGCLSAYLYNFMVKSKSYWVLVVFMQLNIGFIMLYPKGEFDNLSLLPALSIFMSVITLKIMSGFNSKSNKNEINRL